MRTRSSSHKYLLERTATTRGITVMAGYSRWVPSLAGTVRPYRHRVPVRRCTPTTRQASALLTPRAISRAYSSRCAVNGAGPGTPAS